MRILEALGEVRGELGDVGAEHRHEAPAEQRFDDVLDGILRRAGAPAVQLELRVLAQDRAVELLQRGGSARCPSSSTSARRASW